MTKNDIVLHPVGEVASDVNQPMDMPITGKIAVIKIFQNMFLPFTNWKRIPTYGYYPGFTWVTGIFSGWRLQDSTGPFLIGGYSAGAP